MSTGEIENIYRDAGALLEGHFLLSSGNHSRFYLQSARVLENPSIAEYLARKLAQQIRDYFLVGASPGDSGMHRVGLASADSCVANFAGERSMQSSPLPAIGAVCSPAIGGILAGYELARSLGVRFVFTERVNGTMTLRRGFCIGERENVLICEDIVTTGGSAMEAAECVRRLGGNVVCIAAIASRGFAKRVGSSLESRPESKLPPDIPFFALADFIFDMFPPSECELCRTSVAYKPGSRTP